MDISSIALQGIQQAESQLQNTATDMASGAANGANLNISNLSADMVSLSTAQFQVEAGLSALKIAGQLQQNLLDIMA